MRILFLLIFAVSGSIHLWASYRQNKKLRAATKGFILPALLGWYCCTVASPSPLVITALLASWLGDVLLIPKGVGWFTAGGISFIVSHFFFAAAYYQHISFAAIPLWFILLSGAVYLGAVCWVFSGLRAHLPKALFYPMFVYLLANGTMNCFAFFQLLSVPCTAAVITFVGAVLFFASDSLLFYVRFKKDTRLKTHFSVMLTYIFAEFLITLGLILIG